MTNRQYQTRPIIGCLQVYISIFFQIYVFINIYLFSDSLVNKYILLILFPLYFLLTSFFSFYFVNIIYNIIAPKYWVERDSKYLSFYQPIPSESPSPQTVPNIDSSSSLSHILSIKESPVHITIQIPVYTESFEHTLLPTFENALRACRKYNAPRFHSRKTSTQCISPTLTPHAFLKANIFINDDGFFHLSPEDQEIRRKYYNEHPGIFSSPDRKKIERVDSRKRPI